MLQSFIRRPLSVLACAVATAIIGIDFSVAGKPANAAVIDVSCPVGSQATQYKPGITLQEQQISLKTDGLLTTCVSSDSSIVSGSYKITTEGMISCTLSSLAPFDFTIKWNNKQSSTVHVIPAVNEKPLGETVAALTGSVVSGEFEGDMVTVTQTLATLSPTDCATSKGVTSVTGPTTVTLTR